MYTHEKNIHQKVFKSVPVSLSKTSITSQHAVELVDNRPKSIVQRKMAISNTIMSSPLKSLIPQGRQVFQRVSNLQEKTKIRAGRRKYRRRALKRIERIQLLGLRNVGQSAKARSMFGKSGVVDAKKFNRYFHGHKAMDEMMSTAVTLAHAHTLHQKGKFKAAKDIISLSDRARFPTSHMGHHVPGSRFQHPTSVKTQTYGSRGLAHGSFDRDRAKIVLAIRKPVKAIKTAIAYSMNNGAQPPYAKNSLTKFTTAKEIEEADKAHNLREDYKDYVRGGRGKEVAADEEWNPGKHRGRSVSPPRTRK
ncbi:hypothetical protein KHA90_11420 [Flavobacterium psychroterrae]|uniref:Uncharacterized protein n=1 Tax=Flavobacterium psychroterrae TaxID=2133767 RepID=A0ABS5PBE0_9FLAO|nr:hypothetical protein [Flavobacterium psychroterrae]MBS7231634.1 hypothetical protein [Flavobacterium psychroterrae]